MNTKALVALVPALLLAGCWTFNESSYPETAVTAATPAVAARKVRLTGFEATVTEFEAVQGFRSIYVPGCHGRYRCRPGYYEIVPSVDYVPYARKTDAYLRRAQDVLERAGFTLAADAPDVTVDVRFEGPYVPDGTGWRQAGWVFLTAFLCDFESVNWKAALRVRDAKTGKLVFHHDYDQTFEAAAFGLIPLFGASSCDTLSGSSMQAWCLSALTDRALADVSAYLVNEK